MLVPPSGNIVYSPVSGASSTPEVSGSMMVSTPTRAARRRTSAMSAGSIQPGMMFTLPVFLPVFSPSWSTKALTMLEKPVTWEPT